MLYIDPNTDRIQLAVDEHYRNVRCLIWRKIGVQNVCEFPECSICTGKIIAVEGIKSSIANILSDEKNIKILVKGRAEDLELNNKEIIEKIIAGFDITEMLNIKYQKEDDRNATDNEKLEIFNQLSDVIDYENWFVGLEPNRYYSTYRLAENLNRRSCTYCNRTYTITQTKIDDKGKKSKLIRPQFDHWLPKEKSPLLGLSFFNLIPSCSICNSSVKGRKEFTKEKYLHPYIDDIIDFIEFNYEYFDEVRQYNIEIKSNHPDNELNDRIINTLEDFHLEEMYNAHHPELRDLIKIKEVYSKNYLSSLKTAFPSANLTDNEMYRLAFGVEIESEDFHKRPMSKFKHDILKELEIIP